MRTILVTGAVAALAALGGPAGAQDAEYDTEASELSYSRFAEEHGPEHPLYCMYGYFASKTGDHAVAQKIFNRCIDEAESPAAMVYLSMFYEEGIGTPPDPVKARALMRRAAEKGYSVAQYNLGRDLLQSATTPAERVVALRWLERAAAQDDTDAAELLKSVSAAGGAS